MNIGDVAFLEKEFSETELIEYSNITTDINPIHLDDDFARKSIFKKRIVHGLLIGGLISAVISSKLPGPGSIYLSQTLNFRAPVFLNELVRAEVKIIEIKKNKIITLDTKVTKENIIVIDGQAVVLFDITKAEHHAT